MAPGLVRLRVDLYPMILYEQPVDEALERPLREDVDIPAPAGSDPDHRPRPGWDDVSDRLDIAAWHLARTERTTPLEQLTVDLQFIGGLEEIDPSNARIDKEEEDPEPRDISFRVGSLE